MINRRTIYKERGEDDLYGTRGFRYAGESGRGMHLRLDTVGDEDPTQATQLDPKMNTMGKQPWTSKASVTQFINKNGTIKRKFYLTKVQSRLKKEWEDEVTKSSL